MESGALRAYKRHGHALEENQKMDSFQTQAYVDSAMALIFGC
jgi:hypothetical protein